MADEAERLDKATVALEKAAEAQIVFAHAATELAVAAGQLTEAVTGSQEQALKAIRSKIQESSKTRRVVRARIEQLEKELASLDES